MSAFRILAALLSAALFVGLCFLHYAAQAQQASPTTLSEAAAHHARGVAAFDRYDYTQALSEANAALAANPNFAPALLLKGRTLTALPAPLPRSSSDGSSRTEEMERWREANRQRMREAAQCLQRYLILNPNDEQAGLLREQIEALNAAVRIAEEIAASVTNSDPSSTTSTARRVHIIYKPEPQYTEEARQANVSGTVELRALFSADGLVGMIFVVRPLSHGLTETCIEAVRGIRFEPATIEGRRVPTFVNLAYSLNVH